MASAGPVDHRPTMDDLQGHVDPGLLPTNHMFDPSLSSTTVKEGFKKKSDPQELELQASLIGATIADISASSVKRAPSLTIDEHVNVQKPRLHSICESDGDHASLQQPVSAESFGTDFAAAQHTDDEGHGHAPTAADETAMHRTHSHENDESGSSDSDDASDGSELRAMFASGPMQWLMRQREEGVNPREVLSKLHIELPEDLEVEDDDDLWQLAVTELRDLIRHFARNIHVSRSPGEEPPTQVLPSLSLQGVAEYIKSGQCRRIILMTGAGISTAAGIPDFRSPGSGLYYNLQKYDLPYPQAVFEISYFKKNPVPFVILAKELYPGSYKPTLSHYFSRLLAEKGLLQRHYTQNIDTLERVAGVPPHRLVEAHGSFNTAHCIGCKREYSPAYIKELIYGGLVPTCEEPTCQEWIKPDIVFFGEGLPDRFGQLVKEDFPQCDLLIVAGTSLKVQPFASIIDMVGPSCPRLLVNRESCGEAHPILAMLGVRSGFDFTSPRNVRDVQHLGSCDDVFLELAEALGWKDELEALVRTDHERLEREWRLEADSRGECTAETKSLHISVDEFKSQYMAEKARKAAMGIYSDDGEFGSSSDDDSDDAAETSGGESDRARRASHTYHPAAPEEARAAAANGDASPGSGSESDADEAAGMEISREASVQDLSSRSPAPAEFLAAAPGAEARAADGGGHVLDMGNPLGELGPAHVDGDLLGGLLAPPLFGMEPAHELQSIDELDFSQQPPHDDDAGL